MKFGFRVPSLKKRLAARTSLKRVVRHSLGFKAPRGWGWLTNPRKAAYNRVYNRTSFDIFKAAGLTVGILVVGFIFVVGIIAAVFSDKPSTTAARSPSSRRPAATTTPASVVAPSAVPAATPPPTASVRFATSAEAQQAAIRRYPALGIPGSSLNTAFVARYKLYQQQRPEYFRDNSWPMSLAEEVVLSAKPE